MNKDFNKRYAQLYKRQRKTHDKIRFFLIEYLPYFIYAGTLHIRKYKKLKLFFSIFAIITQSNCTWIQYEMKCEMEGGYLVEMEDFESHVQPSGSYEYIIWRAVSVVSDRMERRSWVAHPFGPFSCVRMRHTSIE